MGAGADERLEGFRMGETKKWWCEMDGGDKGQRGHVTKGKRQEDSTFSCPGLKLAKKTLEKCSPGNSA